LILCSDLYVFGFEFVVMVMVVFSLLMVLVFDNGLLIVFVVWVDGGILWVFFIMWYSVELVGLFYIFGIDNLLFDVVGGVGFVMDLVCDFDDGDVVVYG